MADQKPDDVKNKLLERIASLSKVDQNVSFKDFLPVLEELPEDIPVNAVSESVKFASDQLGRWQAEWHYSWAHSPNTVAKAEMEGWKIICNSSLDALKNKVPEVSKSIQELHELSVLAHSVKRASDYNQSTLFRKLKAVVLQTLSFKLDKIGFKKAASWLYALVLYPKGTVGRISK